MIRFPAMNLNISQKQKMLFIAYNFITVLVTICIYYTTQTKWLYFREGENAYYKKDYAKALEAFSKSMDIGETSPKLLLHFADASLALGKFDAAIEFYDIYLRVDPHDITTQKKLAQALLWNGNFEEAQKIYQKILNRHENTQP